MDEASALEALAVCSPRGLVGEAKVETCRGMLGLHACGSQSVRHKLVPCRHAALCDDCALRANSCPLCGCALLTRRDGSSHGSGGQVQVPAMRLRLYEACVAAGLITPVAGRLGTWKVDGGLTREVGSRQGEDERWSDGSAGGNHDREQLALPLDVRRLFALFDVALDHGLAPVICHYVVDVCLDPTVVSSDAVTAMLLDPRVVLEWARRAFEIMKTDLRTLYNTPLWARRPEGQQDAACTSARLRGVVSVLQTLSDGTTAAGPGASAVGRLAGAAGGGGPGGAGGSKSSIFADDAAECVAPLDSLSAAQLSMLLEASQRVQQHLEVMEWAGSQNLLSSTQQRFPSHAAWAAEHKMRQQAARERALPDAIDIAGKPLCPPRGKLFIDSAMAHIFGLAEPSDEDRGVPGGDERDGRGGDVVMEAARGAGNSSSSSVSRRGSSGSGSGDGNNDGDDASFASMRELGLSELAARDHGLAAGHGEGEGAALVYPPPSLRTAVDGLFLDGPACMATAKKAVLVYYLIDRFWSPRASQEESGASEFTAWRTVVGECAEALSIASWHAAEALLFVLLDDRSDEAMDEAVAQALPQAIQLVSTQIEATQAVDVDAPAPSALAGAGPPQLRGGLALHPRVPRVLLERGQPAAALEALRLAATDGLGTLVAHRGDVGPTAGASRPRQWQGPGTSSSSAFGAGVVWGSDKSTTAGLWNGGGGAWGGIMLDVARRAEAAERLGPNREDWRGGTAVATSSDDAGTAGSVEVSLDDAVTAIRILLEGGLLTEAYLYQRWYGSTLRESMLEADQSAEPQGQAGERRGGEQLGPLSAALQSLKEKGSAVVGWGRRALLAELCWFCVRRGVVDRMIVLPLDDEEISVVHACLMAAALQHPVSQSGSLLVVLYIERCRFHEALAADAELTQLEDTGLRALAEKAPERAAADHAGAGMTVAVNVNGTDKIVDGRHTEGDVSGKALREKMQAIRTRRKQLLDTCTSLIPPAQASLLNSWSTIPASASVLSRLRGPTRTLSRGAGALDQQEQQRQQQTAQQVAPPPSPFSWVSVAPQPAPTPAPPIPPSPLFTSPLSRPNRGMPISSPALEPPSHQQARPEPPSSSPLFSDTGVDAAAATPSLLFQNPTQPTLGVNRGKRPTGINQGQDGRSVKRGIGRNSLLAADLFGGSQQTAQPAWGGKHAYTGGGSSYESANGDADLNAMGLPAERGSLGGSGQGEPSGHVRAAQPGLLQEASLQQGSSRLFQSVTGADASGQASGMFRPSLFGRGDALANNGLFSTPPLAFSLPSLDSRLSNGMLNWMPGAVAPGDPGRPPAADRPPSGVGESESGMPLTALDGAGFGKQQGQPSATGKPINGAARHATKRGPRGVKFGGVWAGEGDDGGDQLEDDEEMLEPDSRDPGDWRGDNPPVQVETGLVAGMVDYWGASGPPRGTAERHINRTGFLFGGQGQGGIFFDRPAGHSQVPAFSRRSRPRASQVQSNGGGIGYGL